MIDEGNAVKIFHINKMMLLLISKMLWLILVPAIAVIQEKLVFIDKIGCIGYVDCIKIFV